LTSGVPSLAMLEKGGGGGEEGEKGRPKRQNTKIRFPVLEVGLTATLRWEGGGGSSKVQVSVNRKDSWCESTTLYCLFLTPQSGPVKILGVRFPIGLGVGAGDQEKGEKAFREGKNRSFIHNFCVPHSSGRWEMGSLESTGGKGKT